MAPRASVPTVAGKPAYHVPSMAEIDALEPNGFTVASTFSGAGGSCLGYRMAGFRVIWANEFVPAAQESYRANAPTTILDGRDIRIIKPEEILEATGLAQGELDLFDGSPPCQSFSTAGKREKGWGKVAAHGDGSTQVSDDLFFEYVRLLRGLQPRAFIAENVSGLVKGVAKGYFKWILAALKESGYRVGAQVLDASWLGVPQARQRLIFQGVRNDLEKDPVFPKPWPFQYTLRDAIGSPRLSGQIVGNDAFRPIYGTPDEHPTILAGGARTSGDVVESVVHDTGGAGLFANGGAGEVLDRPSPTVTIGVNSLNSRHFKVSSVAHDTDGGMGAGVIGVSAHVGSSPSFSRKPLDIDHEPAPTVCADGSQQRFVVHETPREIRFVGGFSEGTVRSENQPAPSVMAGGIGGSGTTQVGLSILEGDPLLDPETGQALRIPIYLENGQTLDPETRERIDLKGTAIEAEVSKSNPRYYSLRTATPDQASPTVTASGGGRGTAGVVHSDVRKFTLGELRRICGFPDDFILCGSYAERWARLGNAVPPLMMKAISEVIRDRILKPNST